MEVLAGSSALVRVIDEWDFKDGAKFDVIGFAKEYLAPQRKLRPKKAKIEKVDIVKEKSKEMQATLYMHIIKGINVPVRINPGPGNLLANRPINDIRGNPNAQANQIN